MTVKVLILEDNPVARNFLTRVVRESFTDAMVIREAGSLAIARQEIAEAAATNDPAQDNGPFSLVLVDLELPDGSGTELLFELREYPATKVVTTLYSDDEHLFPALQCGADGYLLKEDRFEVLVEELQKIVRGLPPLSPAIARRLLGHFRHSGGPMGANAFQAGLDASAAARASAHRDEEYERLTPREVEVLTYLSKGFTIKEIAGLMSIKWFTVNDHIKSIYKKLNVSSRAEAAVLASKQGLV
jgi:two-component system, NarL family, nitrate/nitrite response regulator NarL